MTAGSALSADSTAEEQAEQVIPSMDTTRRVRVRGEEGAEEERVEVEEETQEGVDVGWVVDGACVNIEGVTVAGVGLEGGSSREREMTDASNPASSMAVMMSFS